MRRSTLATFALAAAFAFNLGTTAKVNAGGGYLETDLVTDLPTLTDKNGFVRHRLANANRQQWLGSHG